MLEVIQENIKNGKYEVNMEYPKKPEGFSYTHKDENGNRNFKDIYIYDENKSVKWNKEHREELVNKYYEEIDKIHRASNEKEEKFKKDLISAVKAEYGLTDNQALNVYVRAWEEGHADGLNQVVYEAMDYADFARDIIDNKRYYC